MATAPVKSQPLHNFSLPFLKWGGKNQTNTTHRFRRPISAGDHGSEPDSESDTRAHRVGSRTARNRFGFYIGEKSQQQQRQSERVCYNNNETDDEAATGDRNRRERSEDAAEEEAETEETVLQKPWNLRPRKSIFSRGAVEIGASSSRNIGEFQETVTAVATVHSVENNHNNNTPQQQPKSLRLRGFAEMQNTERKEKRKFWIALSKEEIEEDIFVMTGSRPARRPKKRPKNVQKQLDGVFPGLWLVGVTADAYRVADTPAKR